NLGSYCGLPVGVLRTCSAVRQPVHSRDQAGRASLCGVFHVTYVAKELRRRLGRTILTALGLALGVGLVIGIIGVSQGLDDAQNKVLAPLQSVGTDILVTRVAGAQQATGSATTPTTAPANQDGGGQGGGGVGGCGRGGDGGAASARRSEAACGPGARSSARRTAAAPAALEAAVVEAAGSAPTRRSTTACPRGSGSSTLSSPLRCKPSSRW